jgi:hypothetical protein
MAKQFCCETVTVSAVRIPAVAAIIASHFAMRNREVFQQNFLINDYPNTPKQVNSRG